jgi:ubiquinone/menaquinone biosynthesis C-methylase UbiE
MNFKTNMTDIDLYERSADKYEELQEKRPDYVYARKAFFDLASRHLKGELTVADFCCGTGNNTLLLSQKFAIKKATLIDINKQFLDIALKSDIRASEIVQVQSDILNVSLKGEHDFVISMFAYHHVRDQDKAKYIEVAKGALKVGGILLLGEIYSPDKNTTLKYYDFLLSCIDPKIRTPELEKFLKQTAESDEFEYKVSQKFAHEQLTAAGFKLIGGVNRIWPLPTIPQDAVFSKDVGTFVEAWKLENLHE